MQSLDALQSARLTGHCNTSILTGEYLMLKFCRSAVVLLVLAVVTFTIAGCKTNVAASYNLAGITVREYSYTPPPGHEPRKIVPASLPTVTDEIGQGGGCGCGGGL